MDIRQIILDEMKKQGITCYRLAKITGLSERTLQNYACGAGDATGGKIGTICDALGLRLIASDKLNHKSRKAR